MTAITNKIFSLLGFPQPVNLLRFDGTNLLPESVLALSISSDISPVITDCLKRLSVKVLGEFSPLSETKIPALVIDASQFSEENSFNDLYHQISPVLPSLQANARIVLIAQSYSDAQSHQGKAFSRSLLGFTKSLAKEVGRKGSTVNIIYMQNKVELELDGALSFLLSSKSTFISGQSFEVSAIKQQCNINQSQKIALVTGAAQGIGLAISKTLARDGFKVVGVDIPQAENELIKNMKHIEGDAISLDISGDDAGKQLLQYLTDNHFTGFDVIVHNAGITRDKTLAKMPEHWWTSTLNINLLSVIKINQCLLENNAVNTDGRIVCMSSMNGFAGQVGQTNYATSKAGLIGYVSSLSQELNKTDADGHSSNITINAVAPGFIETKMTEQIPFMTREMGRRMNALSQGGTPQDVAEAVAFFSQKASYGVSGQTVRVCGLNFIGG